MEYELSTKGYIELADLESVSTKKYLDDKGVHTIGVGSTKSDIPNLESWSWNKEIYIQYAFDIYKTGLEKYIDTVNQVITIDSLKSYEFDALVSTCYNIGQAGFTTSTLAKRVNNGEKGESIRSALLMWRKITVKDKKGNKVKVDSKGLINRRNYEANLFVLGDYKNKTGIINHFEVNSVTHKPMYSKSTPVNCYDYL